ncbi:MAG: CoA transferase [Dehalococcoidia bacterium]
MAKRPLDGVRILDSTYVVAMPYTGGIMTDLGAEVIKVEGIQHPDRSSQLGGPDLEPGHDPWNRGATFNQLNRGKRSLTLDLAREEGRDAFKDLVKVSDVVMENYTPRVMRRWGMDYPNLRKVKPDIIMVSNTGYGHGEGPYSPLVGQATTMEATQGLCSVTGYRGDIPSKAGVSYVDFLATWTGLFAIAAALRHRNKTGKGQWIDLGMYQLGAYWTGNSIMDYIANGRLAERMGNRHPFYAPQGCYPCKGEDAWGVICVRDDEEWAALCRGIGKPELAEDPRFSDALSRARNHDELDEIISAWSKGLDKYDMMEKLQSVGVPAGPVFNAKETNLSPHYWERGFLEKVTWPPERGMNTRVLMGRPWKLSNVPLKITEGVHTIGEDNTYVLRDLLGMEAAQYQELEKEAVIGDRPISGKREALLPPPARGVRPALVGRFPAWYDPDYKKVLDI